MVFIKRHTWKKLNISLLDQINHIVEKPLLTSSIVLLFVTVIVGGLSFQYYMRDFDGFWVQILAKLMG